MFFQVLPVCGCLLSYDGSFEAFVVLLSREYVLSTDDIGNSAEKKLTCSIYQMGRRWHWSDDLPIKVFVHEWLRFFFIFAIDLFYLKSYIKQFRMNTLDTCS